MDRKKTLGKQIVSFERVAPGILIPVGQEKSWWRDKIFNKCPDFEEGSGDIKGLCDHWHFSKNFTCELKNENCKWNGYGNKG